MEFKGCFKWGKFTIAIDPDHNFGYDYGAYGRYNGITYVERDLNMEISLRIKALLKKQGDDGILTRQEYDGLTEVIRPSLERRTNLANSLDTGL